MIEDMMKLSIDIQFPKNSIRRRKDFKKKGTGSSPNKSKGEFGSSP